MFIKILENVRREKLIRDGGKLNLEGGIYFFREFSLCRGRFNSLIRLNGWKEGSERVNGGVANG